MLHMLKKAYTINTTEWDFRFFFLMKCHECLPSVEQSCVSACNAVRGEAPFCSGCLLGPMEAASDCSRL